MDMAELVALARRVACTEGLNRTAFPRVAVNRRSQPGPARRLELRPLFTIVLSGEKRVHTAWKTYSFAEASVLVTSATTPSMSRVVRATPAQPYMSVLLDLEPGVVAPIVDAREPPAGRGITTLAAVSTSILELVGDLIAGSPARAAASEQALIARLATSEHGQALRQVAARAVPDSLVQEAMSEIAGLAERRLSVERLAAQLGTSVSTLHHRFKARTGTSPLQHHKRLRLERARELMRLFAWTAERTAKEVGYASPAQFNRDYRRQFGAPPRRDRSLSEP